MSTHYKNFVTLTKLMLLNIVTTANSVKNADAVRKYIDPVTICSL